jgi:DNA-binding response OmpR family regulator
MGDPRDLVLVVEDDRNVRELIGEALRGAGLAVVEVADGEEAVKAARDKRPAAIVLDIGLPILSGVAVADQIREMYQGSVPVIVVTAGGTQADVLHIDPAVHMTKPFDVADLVSAVMGVIASAPRAGDIADQPQVERVKQQPAES